MKEIGISTLVTQHYENLTLKDKCIILQPDHQGPTTDALQVPLHLQPA